MRFFDIFGFCVSLLQMYGVVVYLRGLLPRYIIPQVLAKLDDAQDTVAHAVTTGAIPDISRYGEDLERFTSELALMRTISHRSPKPFQQIQLAVQHRLTFRLYSLSSQIDAVRVRVELAIDDQRLHLRVIPRNVILTSVSVGDVARPMVYITLPTAPPPAHMN